MAPRRRWSRSWAIAALTLLSACTSELDTVGEPLRIVGSGLSDAVLREPYEEPVHVVGGLRPYQVELVDGQLPEGLRLEAGVLRGSPEEVGSFTFTVEASDANLSQVVQEFVLRVTATPPPSLSFAAPQTEVRGPITLRATVSEARALTGMRTLVRWDASAYRLREGSVAASGSGYALLSEAGEGTLQVDVVPLGRTVEGRRELFRFVLEPLAPPTFVYLTYEVEFASASPDPERRHDFAAGAEGRRPTATPAGTPEAGDGAGAPGDGNLPPLGDQRLPGEGAP